MLRTWTTAVLTAMTIIACTSKEKSTLRPVDGCVMEVPAYLTDVKRGRDFVWLSDGGVAVMRNICVYSYAADSLEQGAFADKRDSVMKQNVPGEEPGMYMQTERRMPLLVKVNRRHRPTYMTCRGHWQMEGDMMGGPFVSISRWDSVRRRVVVAEAFVYAPDEKKQAAMQQLTKSILTLRIDQ